MNPTYKIILGNGGSVPTGLVLASDNNIIKGLVLQDFGDGTPSANDIAISITGNNNQVLGCYIGVEATGVTKGTKTFNGIKITGSDNSIGDGTPAGANLISGMNTNGQGILIAGASATGNMVMGNMIGLQKDGTTIVTSATQKYGILINGSATGNTIGGNASGEGNVISGNSNGGGGDNYAIYINTTTGSGNTVVGNIIGTTADGITYITSNNQKYGICIDNSPNNTIGGNTALKRNIISANELYGVFITGSGSTGNNIKGNYIGINKTGNGFITGSAQDVGISVSGSSANNTMGGTNSGDGNLVSGNQNAGIWFQSTAGIGNTILGNIIGPKADGLTDLPSNIQTEGIEINCSGSTIGGNTAGARNTISANLTYGIQLTGAACSTNVVKGNYIGIDSSGTTNITGNSQDYGIWITSSASGNTIGGSGSNEGNVISGNANTGVATNSTAGTGNTILGNIVGPQKNGTTYVTSNSQDNGIEVIGSPNNIIGGNTAGARNIISANELYGLYISGAGSTGNSIKGNYIGIDKNGTSFITGSGQDKGVWITSSAGSNTIGGSDPGEGNVISGNSSNGIEINSTAVGGNSVMGNIIGPQANGTSYLASNGQYRLKFPALQIIPLAETHQVQETLSQPTKLMEFI